MNCQIRRATKGDAEEIFGLVKAFATSFKPKYDDFRQSFEKILDNDSAWLSIAEYSKEIVGYCLGFDHFTFYANGRVAWVEEITVKVELRRQGIGRELMQAFEHWAKQRGSGLVGLATRRADKFYLSLRYEQSALYFRKLLK